MRSTRMLTDEFNKRAGKNYFYRETLRQNDQSRFKAPTTLYQLVYLRNQERKFSCFLFSAVLPNEDQKSQLKENFISYLVPHFESYSIQLFINNAHFLTLSSWLV